MSNDDAVTGPDNEDQQDAEQGQRSEGGGGFGGEADALGGADAVPDKTSGGAGGDSAEQ